MNLMVVRVVFLNFGTNCILIVVFSWKWKSSVYNVSSFSTYMPDYEVTKKGAGGILFFSSVLKSEL